MILNGKHIIVGVTGGIAAYKSCELVRFIIKNGGQVTVIVTENAQKFVTPLTFETLSKNKVITKMFDQPDTYEIEHISLSEKCDLAVIAPATANIIAKYTAGFCDDFLSTFLISCKSPKLFAPAMNTSMWENPVTRKNLKTLQGLGINIIEPDTGELACDTIGKGRMAEPSKIFEKIVDLLSAKGSLAGKSVLISSGPTREFIDPVRFISNPSTGKMGFALAKAAHDEGADVMLVTGPVDLKTPTSVSRIDVVTAEQMHDEIFKIAKNFDIIIMTAAVADYTPIEPLAQKMKKTKNDITIKFKRTKDILSGLKDKFPDKVIVGFAAETENLIENAKSKLKAKKLDLIVANDITQKGAGFGEDTNSVVIIDKSGSLEETSILKKDLIAKKIIEKLSKI
jgi:phosphopantothenoylcysteine decarboxylase / phosphopantothenate---cysteine ligase